MNSVFFCFVTPICTIYVRLDQFVAFSEKFCVFFS